MALVLKKAGKYLVGHDYATGRGYSFHWSKDITKARRWHSELDNGYESLRQLARCVPEKVESTRKELRAYAKALQASNARANQIQE